MVCNCKSEISNAYNVAEGHCLQAMKIVHHYVNGCFDWLISVYSWRDVISLLPGKYKRFTFVYPVKQEWIAETVDVWKRTMRLKLKTL